MLVLSGHSGGRASHAAMNADLVVLAGAGPEWCQRVRRLASNAPSLDIFTEGYVIRNAAGWQITNAGRKALRLMDKPLAETSAEISATVAATARKPELAIVACGTRLVATPPANVMHASGRRRLPLREV